MIEWLFSWEVSSWVVALAVAIAFGVLALNDYKLAKTFFLLAAADALGGIFMWGVTTSTPSLIRGIAIFVVIGAIGVLTVEAIRYVDKKQKANSTPPEPPKVQASNITWNISHIDLWSGVSIVEKGKKIGFRFTFLNSSQITATDVHIVNVSALVDHNPVPYEMEQIFGTFRSAASVQKKQKRMIGSTVEPGNTAYIDITSQEMTSAQAKSLLSGTGKLFEYFWIGWKDSDGHDGEQEFATFFTKPKSKQITEDDIKAWPVLQLPPKPL